MSYDNIAGYTYRADNFTPAALIAYMVARGDLSPAARDMDVEEVLDQHAGALGIDRGDERTFDSDDFPKVILEFALTCSDREWTESAPAHTLPDGETSGACVECGTKIHAGHRSFFTGAWFCDTCNSPYCNLI